MVTIEVVIVVIEVVLLIVESVVIVIANTYIALMTFQVLVQVLYLNSSNVQSNTYENV